MTRTMMKRTGYDLTDLLFCLVLAGLFFSVVTPAFAQMTGQDFADRRQAFYVTGDGAIGLVLDRSGPQTVLRINNSSQSVILRSKPAARGDQLLQNEHGHVVLRLTSFGPATYYPNGDLRGIPVLRTARHESQPRQTRAMAQLAKPAGSADVKTEAKRRAANASIALGGSVVFDASWAPLPKTGTETLSEAISNAATALDNLAMEPDVGEVLAERLNRVRFEEKAEPGLRREGGTLYVDYADAPGHAGRPTSASIMSFLRQIND